MQPQDPFQPSAPQGPPAGFNPQPQQVQPQSASQMKAHKPVKFIVVVVILSLFLIGSLVYGFMMMSSRNDFRDNVEDKITKASEIAVSESKAEQEAEFVEREKEPLKTYSGPSQFGSLVVRYPKTWAAYFDESGKGNTPIDGYLHPNYVPSVNSGISFALRVEVLESAYDRVLDGYTSDAKKGSVTVQPITLEKVPSVAGSRLNGEVEKDKQGSVVLFPLRDKTIKISVLSDQFIKDFNEIILREMSFIP